MQEQVILKIKDLAKFYGSFRAVDDISFDVKPGEIVGLLAPRSIDFCI